MQNFLVNIGGLGFIVSLIGLCIGSFLNVCIDRIPRESIFWTASRRTDCDTKLKVVDLIPVVRYIFLNRKCRCCRDSISPQSVFIELLTGFLFAWIYLRVGWSVELLEYSLLTSILLVITVIDIKTMEIPDEINLFGLILAFVFLIIKYFLYQESILSHIFGFLVGGGIFLLIAIFTNAMGGGDIKLMAVLGLWMGFKQIFIITALSFFIGAVVSIILLVTKKKGRKDFIPYGPFIAAAALATMLYGSEIWEAYKAFSL